MPARERLPGGRASEFRDNAVRLQFRALVYNLANVIRTLILPREAGHWSLTTPREKLVEIGATVASYSSRNCGGTTEMMRFWSDLSTWNKFGLAFVGTVIIVVIIMAVVS